MKINIKVTLAAFMFCVVEFIKIAIIHNFQLLALVFKTFKKSSPEKSCGPGGIKEKLIVIVSREFVVDFNFAYKSCNF